MPKSGTLPRLCIGHASPSAPTGLGNLNLCIIEAFVESVFFYDHSSDVLPVRSHDRQSLDQLDYI